MGDGRRYKVDDRHLAAGATDPHHLADLLFGALEVVHGEAAYDQVEGSVEEAHARGVSQHQDHVALAGGVRLPATGKTATARAGDRPARG